MAAPYALKGFGPTTSPTARGLFQLNLNARQAFVKLRGARGWWVSDVIPRVNSAHHALAYMVQREMVDKLEAKIRATGRPQRGTQILRRVLEDERNRKMVYKTISGPAGASSGFIVGIPSWLDASPAAKYWRNLEFGSDVHIGRRYIALFQGEGVFSEPSADRFRRDTRFAFVPGSTPGISRSGRANVQMRPFEIKKPIPEYEYLREGARKGLPKAYKRAAAEYRFEGINADYLMR